MARKVRVQYPGAIYHVINRGDRREAIFQDDSDRRLFLDTLAEVCAKTGWQILAWCLMKNHFHLVIETPEPNLVAGMKWFLGTYTGRFNRRHKLSGHLFGGRYKALIIDSSANGYMRTACDYVHLNPVRAKLLAADQPLREFVWSSFPDYLKPPARRPPWLRVDRLFGEAGIHGDTATGRREFELRMEQRRAEEHGDDWKTIRRGWYLGEESFRKELLAKMAGQLAEHHYGEERHESAEEKAERLVRQGLKQAHLTEDDLVHRRKSDPLKLRLALQLRRETTVTLKWIAQRLQMGAWTYLSQRLYEQRNKDGRRKS